MGEVKALQQRIAELEKSEEKLWRIYEATHDVIIVCIGLSYLMTTKKANAIGARACS